MGGSSWSDDHYTHEAATRSAAHVSDFAYSKAVMSAPSDKRTVHTDLNILGKDRESRDGPTHPESLAIGVVFDVTGSMHQVPVTLQKKLGTLMALLLKKAYVDHPQILCGAVGDAFFDKVPLQIGQFESGYEMDENLRALVLEAGGGSGTQESYDLALYYFAHHTQIDCFETRGQKGYLFLIGDEGAYEVHDAEQIRTIIGDNQPKTRTIFETVKALQERYNVFMIRPMHTSNAKSSEIRRQWEKLLGPQNVISIEEEEAICETIAMAIGMSEGRIGVEDGLDHLKSVGASAAVVEATSRALAPLAKSGAVAGLTTTGILPTRKGAAANVARL